MKIILKISFLLLCILTLNILTSCSKKYTVTFKDYDGILLKEENVKKGDDATAPTNPTREGYIFIGWDNEYINIQKDTILIAQYKIIQEEVKEYTVTFNSNGGSVIEKQQIEKGNKAMEPVDPTRDGYIFDGWYLNGEKWIFIGYVVTENITLMAKWNICTYQITYDLNGGSVLNPELYTVEDEIKLKNPIKSGYTFIGWTNSEIEEPQLDVTFSNEINDKHFVANFIPNEYKLSFDTNGGNETYEDITISYNHIFDVASYVPTRKGYEFVGWYNEEEKIEVNIYNYLEDITLVAKWKINKYLITFNTDGGNYIADLEFTIESKDLILPIPIKERYKFLCWQENDIVIDTLELKNYNLVAKWELIYSLEYGLSKDGTCYSVIGIGNVIDVNIIIPSIYNNLPVTNISSHAFEGCTNLISIELPNSITSIGTYAFYECTSLKNIEIPNSITNIKEATFADCTSLENIEIPNSITNIGYFAFYNCTSLTSVEIPNSIKSIESYAFRGCISLESIIIPDSVLSLGEESFFGCENLTYINISKNIICIGEAAFYNCTSLTNITIPESVKKIEDCVFSFCESLETIIIPNSVTSIGSYAFRGCTSLENIVIPESVTRIEKSSFLNCISLISITIPFVGETVNGLENTHFGYIFGASSLSENKYYVPSTLKEVILTGGTIISSYAFNKCTSLESIIIPNSVTNIGAYAFDECINLTNIEIPNSVTSIGSHAFFYCSNLKSVEIPNSVTSIGYKAFIGCESLIIYCETTSKPSGWDSTWNYSNRPVVWGYVEE